MPASTNLPWPALLTWLRDQNAAPRDRAAMLRAGLDPDVLLAQGVVRRLPQEAWRPPSCRGDCQVTMDLVSRREDGLVGLGCPREPACWDGWRWVPADSLNAWEPDLPAILVCLAAANGLLPLKAPDLPGSFVPLGLWRWCGQAWPVIWAHRLTRRDHLLAAGLKASLEADRLILTGPQAGLQEGAGWLYLPLPERMDGAGLALWRALDVWQPNWRRDVSQDKIADFPDIRLAFGCAPGRHVVRVNDREVASFARSDHKFLRLLTLARARSLDPDGGWVSKARLEIGESDKELDHLRTALARIPETEWAGADLRQLIRTSPARDGTVRLAVPAAQIAFLESLQDFAPLGDDGAARGKRRADLKQAAQITVGLCKKLGKTGLVIGG